LPADNLSDLSSRYALVAYAVILGSDGTFLQHKPVKVSCIEPMHSRPAVEPVAHIC
jgi:hypothetical protein